MRPAIVKALRSRRALIRDTWERLLRVEPVNGPLAHPDALVHHILTSILQILELVAKPPPHPLTAREARAIRLPVCPCGRNPFRAYFVAGEQAMLEALVLGHAEAPDPRHHEVELAELIFAVRQIASGELEDFCGACILKHAAALQLGEPTAAG